MKKINHIIEVILPTIGREINLNNFSEVIHHASERFNKNNEDLELIVSEINKTDFTINLQSTEELDLPINAIKPFTNIIVLSTSIRKYRPAKGNVFMYRILSIDEI